MADSPFETVATAIITIFDAEFAVEGFTMIPDNIHESLGERRVSVGIAPVEDVVVNSNSVVQETWVEVRFYDIWKREYIKLPEIQVNPYRVTAFAQRFRNALRVSAAQDPGTGQVWYFDLRRVTYPNDPTGNKTRFHATIRAFGNNAALVETTA